MDTSVMNYTVQFQAPSRMYAMPAVPQHIKLLAVDVLVVLVQNAFQYTMIDCVSLPRADGKRPLSALSVSRFSGGARRTTVSGMVST